mgnify:CR=1 FL=1
MKYVEEAGFPKGVVNVVTGFGMPVGNTLTAHPLVRRVAFTGGSESARHVVRNTAENFAQVSLELGGKSPNIVFEDADPESAAMGIIAGIFGASGQSCVAGSRALLHVDIYDQVLEKLVERVEQIKIGDPLLDDTEMGPLATEAQLERVKEYVGIGQAEGGKIVIGGKTPENTDAGWYFEPTIIELIDHDARIAQEEIFGPVLSIIPFKDEEEAIALANGTEYALATGIWTRDVARAHRVAKAVHAGIIWVNTYRSISPLMPIGGSRLSGHGRESGFDAIYEYTQSKAVWINTSSEPMPDPFIMR